MGGHENSVTNPSEIIETEEPRLSEPIVPYIPYDYFKEIRERNKRAIEWFVRYNKSYTKIWEAGMILIEKERKERKARKEERERREREERGGRLLTFICFTLLLSNIWLFLSN